MTLMVPAYSHTHMSYSQPTYGALIMRNDADYQIMFKQFPVRVLSLSTPRFQHPQKASNYASNGVCLLSRLPGTVEITKKASTSFVEFNIEFKGNSGRGALRLGLSRVTPEIQLTRGLGYIVSCILPAQKPREYAMTDTSTLGKRSRGCEILSLEQSSKAEENKLPSNLDRSESESSKEKADELPSDLVRAVCRQLLSSQAECAKDGDSSTVKVGAGAPVFLAGVLQSLMKTLLADAGKTCTPAADANCATQSEEHNKRLKVMFSLMLLSEV